jgi:sulfur-oxidizing protein SoxA
MDRRQRHAATQSAITVVWFLPLLLVPPMSPAAGEIPPAERRSGYELMSPETRAMQDDEATGPAAFSLLDGEALWRRKEGQAGIACASCHASMKGVAVRYPKVESGRAVNLEQQINVCRTGRQKAPPGPTSREPRAHRLRPASCAACRSPSMERATAPFRGSAAFNRRQGQLNLLRPMP